MTRNGEVVYTGKLSAEPQPGFEPNETVYVCLLTRRQNYLDSIRLRFYSRNVETFRRNIYIYKTIFTDILDF